MPRTFKRRGEPCLSTEAREWRGECARTMAVETPTRNWVVEGLVRRGEVAALRGMPKTGKTVRAASLGAAVSRGEAFEGRATRRTNVLYLAAEETPQEWAVGAGPFLGETDRWFRVRFGAWRLDRDEELFDLRREVEFGGVGLVAVDPILAAAVDVRRAAEGLRTIAREKDVAVMAIHHAERRGRGMRLGDVELGYEGGSLVRG